MFPMMMMIGVCPGLVFVLISIVSPMPKTATTAAVFPAVATGNGTDDPMVIVATTNNFTTVPVVGRSSSSSFSSKVSTVVKLLQLVNTLATMNISSLNKNDSHSETRSMTSWLPSSSSSSSLRHKRPAGHQRRNNNDNHNLLLNFVKEPKRVANIHKPSFIPLNGPELYPFNETPNPFLFFPPLSDTTTLDYWLKFLEDPKLDDRLIPIMWDKIDPDIRQQPKKQKKMKINSRLSTNMFDINNGGGGRRFLDNNNNPSGSYEDNSSGDNDIDNDPETFQRGKKLFTNNQKNYGQQNGYGSLENGSNEYETSPRCDKFTDDICIDDFEYPEHAILEEIYKRRDLFQLMYTEVHNDGVPLVDGIPKDQDESFSHDYYYSNNENESDDYEGGYGNNFPTNNKSLSSSSSSEYDFEPGEPPSSPASFSYGHGKAENHQRKNNVVGGYVCRSEVLYAKPKLAKNLRKKWRVIVNAGDYTQTIRMEKCIKANGECRFIVEHKYESRCAQVDSIHRLLVFEKGKGFYIDSFRIPTACTCHVYGLKPSYLTANSAAGYSGESSQNVKRTRTKQQQQPTLWSLFDGGSGEQQTTFSNNNNQLQQPNDENNRLNQLLFLAQQQRHELITNAKQNHHHNHHQAINILNNNELLKLLPQLTANANAVDSDNTNIHLLQPLLEEFGPAGGGGPDPTDSTALLFANHHDNNHHHPHHHQQQQQQTPYQEHKNHLEYQLALAPEKAPPPLPPPPYQHHHHGSMVPPPTPNTRIGGGSEPPPPGAPVVQVIHMPVHSSSSGFVPTDPLNNVIWPFNGLGSSYSKYLTSASNNYNSHPKPIKNYNLTLANSTTIGTAAITSTTTMAPTIVAAPKTISGFNNNDTVVAQKSSTTANNNNNQKKKINFSYHPILEYIAN